MPVHSTAIIAPGAELDSTVEVGPYAVIGPKVRIGPNTSVGAHAVIEGRTTIGAHNRIFHHTSVGAVPQDLKYDGEDTALVIGDNNRIREFVSIHLGTAQGGGNTRIGSRNLFMAQSHVAHDCSVGNDCVLANSVALGGHVQIENNVTLGGMSGVHQFVRIGAYSFVSAGTIVVMDVAPYCTVQGDRAELVGLNLTGLKRAGFDTVAIANIKRAYHLLFRANLALEVALDELRREFPGDAIIERLIHFATTQTRGLTR